MSLDLSNLQRLRPTERILELPGTAQDEVLALNEHLTVPALVELQARSTPFALAVADGGVSLTFTELEERSRELAVRLRALGVKRDVVVGVFAQRSVALVIGALAVMRAGAAYLPLDPSYPLERLTLQIADSGADILIMEAALSENDLARVAKHVLLCDSHRPLADELPANDLHADEIRAEDLAYVIYTSGSTGRPKGVEITHGGLSNLVSWFQNTLALSPKDRLSHVAAVGFDATVWEIWPGLAAGASIHVADNDIVKDPRKLQDWLVSTDITVSFVPTPMAERLMASEWPDRLSLRTMMTGGDTLHVYPSPNLPFKVVNNYGPTECSVCVISGALPSSDGVDGLPPLGRPITNTQIYIVDQFGVPVPDGCEGEIWIGGRGVGRGYRNRPDLTAEKFIANPFAPELSARLYRSGDRACVLADGQIAFKGRVDDQIKIRGVRMEPGEIEAALNTHPSVKESAVVASPFGQDEKRLVGYIVLSAQDAPTVRQLREFLATRLPATMIPSVFVLISGLPLNSSGKINRRALPAPNEVKMISTADITPARDELEMKLQEIWKETLKVQNIGIDQDFFELGGDSLLAASLIVSVERALNLKVPLSALLQVRTIEGMARAIRIHDRKGEWSSLVSVQPFGARPPLFCIHSHTGDVMFCEYISRGAGPDQPIYGLQSQAVTGRRPHYSVVEMAEHYVHELKNVQPHGPYHLFGFCFGGMIALEMARILAKQSEAVEFLGAYNTPAPGTLKGWPLGQFTYLKRRTQHEWKKLLTLEYKAKWPHIRRNLRNFRIMVQRSVALESRRIFSGGPGASHRNGALDLESINIAAAKGFSPDYIFPGRITLFVSPDVAHFYPVSPQDGWKALAAQGIELISVPLDDKGWRGTPFVQTVGGKIAAVLGPGNTPQSDRG